MCALADCAWPGFITALPLRSLLGTLTIFASFLIIVSDAYAAASTQNQAYPSWSGMIHGALGAISIAGAVAWFIVTIVLAAAGAVWVIEQLD